MVFLVYPTTMETLTRGKSFGKLALGLRVVRDDGGTVTAQQSFVRALIGIVEIYAFLRRTGVLLLPGQLARQADRRLRRRHLRRPRPGPAGPAAPAVPMPAVLAGWAACRRHRARRRSGSTLAVRQYLGRLPTLDPASRDRLGAMLATRMSEYVAPPPPPGTTAWDFLRAVSAARRDRDLARLHRDETLRARLTARSR